MNKEEYKKYHGWKHCASCGAFLKYEGVWVGESHYDDFATVKCNNPRCKLRKLSETKERR